MSFQKIDTLNVIIDPLSLRGKDKKGKTIPLRPMELLYMKTVVETKYENHALDLTTTVDARLIRTKMNAKVVENDPRLVFDAEAITPNTHRVLKANLRKKYHKDIAPIVKQ
jgi:hypothetical protein